MPGDPVDLPAGGRPLALRRVQRRRALAHRERALAQRRARRHLAVAPGARDDARPQPGGDGRDGAPSGPGVELQQRARRRPTAPWRTSRAAPPTPRSRASTRPTTSRTRTTTSATGCSTSRATPTYAGRSGERYGRARALLAAQPPGSVTRRLDAHDAQRPRDAPERDLPASRRRAPDREDRVLVRRRRHRRPHHVRPRQPVRLRGPGVRVRARTRGGRSLGSRR